MDEKAKKEEIDNPERKEIAEEAPAYDTAPPVIWKELPYRPFQSSSLKRKKGLKKLRQKK